MFLPIKTEAHDGRIRMGSVAIVLICLVVHILVSRDQSQRAGRMMELEREVMDQKVGRKFDDLLDQAGGQGVFDTEEDREERKAEAEETRAALEAERQGSLMYRLALVVGDFNPLNLITHQFTHGDWLHLIFNMWFFYIVGISMEKYWGLGRFLGIYLACGVLAALGFILLAGSRNAGIPMVGASGAIAGMMGAFAATHGDAKVMVMWIFGVRVKFFAIPAGWYLGFWAAGQVWDSFLHSNQAGGVAFAAHAAGFFAGLAAGKKIRGDAFYEKAYKPEFDLAVVDKLSSDAKLDIPKEAPAAAHHQDGTLVTTLLNRGLHALEHGDRKAAGEDVFHAMEKALTIVGLDSRLVEGTLRRVLEALPSLDLPPGAVYAWARKLEQKDWWQWAILLYDAAAADFTPGTSPHSRSSSLFRAADLRLSHGHEKDRALLGLQAVMRNDPGSPLAADAEARLADLAAAGR